MNKKKLIGAICLTLAFFAALCCVVFRNELPFIGQQIKYTDGCVEKYNFDGDLKTPECKFGRWLANQSEGVYYPSADTMPSGIGLGLQ